MVTVKIYESGAIKVNGQFEGSLPATFEIENVDTSAATITPEQAMATVAAQPFVAELGEFALRQQWMDLVRQAARMVVDSI